VNQPRIAWRGGLGEQQFADVAIAKAVDAVAKASW
jgi:hypothetical protein